MGRVAALQSERQQPTSAFKAKPLQPEQKVRVRRRCWRKFRCRHHLLDESVVLDNADKSGILRSENDSLMLGEVDEEAGPKSKLISSSRRARTLSPLHGYDPKNFGEHFIDARCSVPLAPGL